MPAALAAGAACSAGQSAAHIELDNIMRNVEFNVDA
jgi:hypothetical protein